MTESLLGAPLVRVDRRGYSGAFHAARHTNGVYVTLCGRQAVGNAWHLSPGEFNPRHIDWRTTPYARFSPYDPLAAALAAGWMHASGRGGEWSCK